MNELVIKLVRRHLVDLQEVGQVGFQIRLNTQGSPTEFAILDDYASMLLITHMRSIGVVKDFKRQLVVEFKRMRDYIRNHQTESLRLTNDNLVKLQSEHNVVKINPDCAKSILKERNNKLVNDLPLVAIEMGLIASLVETVSVTRYYPTPLGTELGLTMTNHTINYPESLHSTLKSEVAVKRWLRARMKQVDLFEE